MSDLLNELKPLIGELEAIWSRVTPMDIRALWDPDESEPYYIAEEIEDPMCDWDTIEAYWQASADYIATFELHTSGHRAKLVAPGLASVLFSMRWTATLTTDPRPITFDVKTSALLRQTGAEGYGGWRLCQWIESPLGPLPYIKKAYRAGV